MSDLKTPREGDEYGTAAKWRSTQRVCNRRCKEKNLIHSHFVHEEYQMTLPSEVIVQTQLRSNTDNSNSLHFLTVSYGNLRVSSSAVQSNAEM